MTHPDSTGTQDNVAEERVAAERVAEEHAAEERSCDYAATCVESIEILEIGPNGPREATDVVAPEYALHLSVNGKLLATLMCVPDALDELITGFLMSEGLIRNLGDIRSISIAKESGEASVSLGPDADLPLKLYGKRIVNTGCGSPSLFPRTLDSLRSKSLPESTPILVSALLNAMRELQHSSQLFRKTGGVHSAAIVHEGRIRFFREDVGRHNAVDKVAGDAVLHGIPREECALLCSGRISSDLVTKATVHRIPIVASRSAPTGRAVEIAQSVGMGLAGFVRGRRMNIYSGRTRFQLDTEAAPQPAHDASRDET